MAASWLNCGGEGVGFCIDPEIKDGLHVLRGFYAYIHFASIEKLTILVGVYY